MKTTYFLFLLLMMFATTSYSQKDKKTISKEETKNILSAINIDTTSFLKEVSVIACKCIDSITLSKKTSKEISDDISSCIDSQVTAYQFVMKLTRSMKEGGKKMKIEINTNKKSPEYKSYYYEIERWLKDSCASLKKAVRSENKESEFSMSKDPNAIEQYNLGTNAMQEENYTKALPYLEEAVNIDPRFAFAWDNIGICNRRLGNFDAALVAYNKSLKLDAMGKTPLQNIPIVYEFKKEYDMAIQAYQNILKVYPNDPEAFYGAGKIYYFYKNDMETALQYMCKAYNIYAEIKSPYRVDAEKIINLVNKKMKEDGKENRFYEILKGNNIKSN